MESEATVCLMWGVCAMRWVAVLVSAVVIVACGGDSAEPTSTVTLEPVAESTATQPAATATPVPAQADVRLGAWQLRAAENQIQVYIEGEAVNEGDAHAQEISVAIRLYDAAGEIIASERAYIIQSVIPAGGMSPFLAYVNGIDIEDIDDTQIDIQFQTYEEDSFHGFTYTLDIEIVQLNWTENRIVGEVRNMDEFPVRNVSVAIIGYDDDGEIVSVERATMDSDQVEPGMTAGFSSNFLGHDDVPTTWVALPQGSRVR